MKPNGGPAFPREDYQTNGRADGGGGQQGMSLRDYFAGQAVAGFTSSADAEGAWTGADPHTVAANAYQIADAMLAEREKP